jgi:hypothetical protein
MRPRRLSGMAPLLSAAALAAVPGSVAAFCAILEHPAVGGRVLLALAVLVTSLSLASAAAFASEPDEDNEDGDARSAETPIERSLRAIRLMLGWGIATAAAAGPATWLIGLWAGEPRHMLNAGLWCGFAVYQAGLAVIVHNALVTPDGPAGGARVSSAPRLVTTGQQPARPGDARTEEISTR